MLFIQKIITFASDNEDLFNKQIIMKKFLLMAFLLLVGVGANAAVNGDDKKTDIVLSDGEDYELTMHLGLGVNMALDVPDGYDFAPFKSWDVQWTALSYDFNPKGGSQTYSIGFGLNWSNFGLKDNGTVFDKGNNNMVGLMPALPGSDDRYSSIHRLSLNIPILFTQDFGKNFSLTLGPVVNFNTGLWLHNSWSDGDLDYNATTRKLKQNPVTVDVMGVFDIFGVGIYCKYSPMKVFKKGYGPEFQSLTLGLYL